MLKATYNVFAGYLSELLCISSNFSQSIMAPEKSTILFLELHYYRLPHRLYNDYLITSPVAIYFLRLLGNYDVTYGVIIRNSGPWQSPFGTRKSIEM